MNKLVVKIINVSKFMEKTKWPFWPIQCFVGFSKEASVVRAEVTKGE